MDNLLQYAVGVSACCFGSYITGYGNQFRILGCLLLRLFCGWRLERMETISPNKTSGIQVGLPMSSL
jgi:hypothetical protein